MCVCVSVCVGGGVQIIYFFLQVTIFLPISSQEVLPICVVMSTALTICMALPIQPLPYIWSYLYIWPYLYGLGGRMWFFCAPSAQCWLCQSYTDSGGPVVCTDVTTVTIWPAEIEGGGPVLDPMLDPMLDPDEMKIGKIGMMRANMTKDTSLPRLKTGFSSQCSTARSPCCVWYVYRVLV